MRIRLNDLALVPELRQHFERSGFVTNRLSAETIEVWRPDVQSTPNPLVPLDPRFDFGSTDV